MVSNMQRGEKMKMQKALLFLLLFVYVRAFSWD